MAGDADNSPAMTAGLDAVEKSAAIIAGELRLMARGGYGFRDFMFVSSRAKFILDTAADMIEQQDDTYKNMRQH